MSKYNKLWLYIAASGTEQLRLSYEEIENISGVPVDHSFLTYKKELIQYGFKVCKISMKEQTVAFERINEQR